MKVTSSILVNPLRNMKPDISNVLSPVKVFVYDCELLYSPKNKMTNFGF